MTNSGAILSGPCALPFLSLLTAMFISSSVKTVERDLSVLGLCRRAVISWFIFLLISLSTLQWHPFSIRTLAIAFALTGQGGVFFVQPVRWLKVCHALLLKWVKSIDSIDNSHHSLFFTLRIMGSFMALELESCPGAAIMYLSYACWHSMSHDGIRHGRHLRGMDVSQQRGLQNTMRCKLSQGQGQGLEKGGSWSLHQGSLRISPS